MNGGCQWGSSAGERRLSAGLTAKTKGLSITSDPRRATHATSATATPERTPCILFIPRARKPSCVINVPLNTSSKPALGCSGTPGFPDSQGGSVLVTSRLEGRGGGVLLARAAAFTLRPSSSTKLNRALQSSSPCLRSRAPSSTAKLVRMLSSHIAIRKAIRFFWESRPGRPGRSSFGNGGLGC